ncbi:MAG TPA: hypothetical protein VNW92_28155, partial [Polyangiaceae bacterium]|nr:hypothetical protein [Polyangiaceae bacterium]
MISAVGCWLGGVWSDAEGADAATRATDAERRCHELVQRVYGANDQTRYERLRALEPAEVSELKTKIVALAKTDPVDRPRAQQLGTFLEASADAEREIMIGRRSADRVKKDVEGTRDPVKLTSDEVAAV